MYGYWLIRTAAHFKCHPILKISITYFHVNTTEYTFTAQLSQRAYSIRKLFICSIHESKQLQESIQNCFKGFKKKDKKDWKWTRQIIHKLQKYILHVEYNAQCVVVAAAATAVFAVCKCMCSIIIHVHNLITHPVSVCTRSIRNHTKVNAWYHSRVYYSLKRTFNQLKITHMLNVYRSVITGIRSDSASQYEKTRCREWGHTFTSQLVVALAYKTTTEWREALFHKIKINKKKK